MEFSTDEVSPVIESTKYGYQHLQQLIKIPSESGSQDLHYAALYEHTPEEFKVYAQEALNETEEKKAKGIKVLKEIAQRENLKWLDEHHMLIIMRSCKYNTKKYEPKLKHLQKIRERSIDRLKKTSSENIEIMIDGMFVGMLPYRDKFGRIIAFTRPNLVNHHMDDNLAIGVTFLLFLLTLPMTSICGVAYIAECKGGSQIRLFRALHGSIHKLASTLLNFPIRYRKTYIINEFILIRWFYAAMIPLLPRKLINMVSFQGSILSNLHMHLHPDILPTDFGGKLGPLNNSFYREKFLNFIKKLLAEEK